MPRTAFVLAVAHQHGGQLDVVDFVFWRFLRHQRQGQHAQQQQPAQLP
jgi:hypothetical protein